MSKLSIEKDTPAHTYTYTMLAETHPFLLPSILFCICIRGSTSGMTPVPGLETILGFSHPQRLAHHSQFVGWYSPSLPVVMCGEEQVREGTYQNGNTQI